ncbi:hypothetical protein E4U53_004692 [Claviceps sorghi]|nr:hypothetical protein E4U53_004692 [Claviceps sorghi]
MAQFVLDLAHSLGNCLNCFPGSPTLRIKSRSFRMLRLLGEGGFSYVYLVEDTATRQLYALKKMRCPLGAESVRQAMREVEAYGRFAHVPGIISAVDHAVATERGAAGDEASGAPTTVYVLLPYYRRGSLQDMINANVVQRTSFPERHLLGLFLGVCRAVRAMHEYQAPPERMQMGDEADEADEADEPEPEPRQPLMQSAPLPSSSSSSSPPPPSYAHRDIKPGNIMIDDAGSTPILMDLGEPIRHIVRQCLRVEPAERPSIGQLITMVEAALAQLPDDAGPAFTP